MQYFINLLTVSRIFFAALIFIFLTTPDKYYLALIFFFLTGISDYFDGYLARKYNLTSELGEVLDPFADKILIVFVLIALSALFSSFYIGFLSSIIISREIGVAVLRDLNARKNNLSATKVTFLAKIKTTIQFAAIFTYLTGLAYNLSLVIVLADIVLFLATIVTLYTGYEYTLNSYKRN